MRLLIHLGRVSLLMTLGANLELEGFEVAEASSGAEALARLERERFDLVLSDIRMPGMDGVELFRRIRQRHGALPVVLMTAFALEGLVDEAIGQGVFTVLPKPCDVSHVVATVLRAGHAPVVLVVDDAAEMAESMARALRTAGLRARAEPDGLRAVELVRAGGVDVCVVDLVMPGMDGAEVIERVHAADPRVACIALSGHDLAEVIRRVAEGRVGMYLKKPVGLMDLLQAIAAARGAPPRPAAGGK